MENRIEIKISDHPHFTGYRRKAILIGLKYELTDKSHCLYTTLKVETYDPEFINKKDIIEANMQFIANQEALVHPQITDENGNVIQEAISDIDLFVMLTNMKEPLLTTLQNTIWDLDRKGKLNDRLGLGLIPAEPNLS